jgi:phage shock protein A
MEARPRRAREDLMGIFGRLGTVIKANLNDLISRAEDPEKMLNQIIIDMKEQLVEAKKQVAVVIADEKRLKMQYESERAQAQEWEKKAMLAVRAGDDNLAREALARKAEHENMAAEYMKQWESQKASADQLREALRMLNKKIDEAQRKKNLLIAKKKRAEAQKTIHATMSGLSDTSAFDTFDRMAQKIEQMEAEAQATAELSSASTEASLEEKFRKLEAEKGPNVDDALAALKAKMGVLPAAQQGQKVEIPVGQHQKETIPRK